MWRENRPIKIRYATRFCFYFIALFQDFPLLLLLSFSQPDICAPNAIGYFIPCPLPSLLRGRHILLPAREFPGRIFLFKSPIQSPRFANGL